MGWLWSSNKDSSTPSPPSQNTTSPKPSDPPPPPPQQNPPPNDASPTSSPPTLLSSTQTPPNSPPHSPSPSDLITPTTTLPTTLSCRTAFDAAFHCQSLGGQFTNVYRYGSLRSCSEHWGDFWFCVRTNRGIMDGSRREETVRAWALNREREKYGKRRGGGEEGEGGVERGSSEDVWEVRRWKVRGAFGGDWGDLEREARERAEVEVQGEVR